MAGEPHTPTPTGDEKEGSIMETGMGFMKQYAAPLIAGVVALIGFSMGGVGTILGFFAAAAAAMFAFMPETVQKIVPDSMKPFFGGKPKPQQYGEITVELGAEPTQSIATIDKRKGDVKLEWKDGKQPMVQDFTYTPEGGTPQQFHLSSAVSVGSVDPNSGVVTIDKAKLEKTVIAEIAKDLRKKGKDAVGHAQANARAVDKEANTFLATSGNGEKMFVVVKDGEELQLKDLDGKLLKKITGVSAADLAPGGIIMREVGTAIDQLPANDGTVVTNKKPDMAAPSYSTTIATLPTSSAVDSHAFTIASDVANAQTSAAKYTISEGHINADPKNNNIVINEITIERNGRKHTYTLPKDAAIGHWKDNAFSVDDTAMKKILVEAVKDDDKKIKEYEKNLSQVTAAANGTDRYVYAAKDGTYIINISATKDSYTIKDLNGNEVDAGKEVKGGNVQDVVREALHTLKDDIKVSSEPVDAKEWLKSLANNAEGLKLQFDNNAYDGRAPSISVNAKATAPTTQFEKKQADGLAMS